MINDKNENKEVSLTEQLVTRFEKLEKKRVQKFMIEKTKKHWSQALIFSQKWKRNPFKEKTRRAMRWTKMNFGKVKIKLKKEIEENQNGTREDQRENEKDIDNINESEKRNEIQKRFNELLSKVPRSDGITWDTKENALENEEIEIVFH